MSSVVPIHPGEHLQEILTELSISPNGLAQAAGIPPSQIGDIVSGNRPVTADAALRIGKVLGTSSEFWLNLQRMYDLDLARANTDTSGIAALIVDDRP